MRTEQEISSFFNGLKKMFEDDDVDEIRIVVTGKESEESQEE